jgi:hypothetical protein
MLFVLAFTFLLAFVSQGDSPSFTAEQNLLPPDYGKVISLYNRESPHQLYIIGMTHRDTLTGCNSDQTPRVQAEVYKIGEWLIQNRGVELVLPEGFFTEKLEMASQGPPQASCPLTSPEHPSMQLLEKKLSDNTVCLNAEMLLKENFPLVMKQVEDKGLYQSVNQRIKQLSRCPNDTQAYFLTKSELAYYQERRVGAMLQKIPGIVNQEFQQGRIHGKKALFTIGLNHIANIIRYLDEKKITIAPPLFTPVKYAEWCDELNLAKENFGICVIIPRTLADDHETLKKNHLQSF